MIYYLLINKILMHFFVKVNALNIPPDDYGRKIES